MTGHGTDAATDVDAGQVETPSGTNTGLGPIMLSMPADPRVARVARLAASAYASLVGCTVDEIDDIKIAVSEVLIALVEHGSGDIVELEFRAEPTSFEVQGVTSAGGFDLADPDLALCRTVLADVCTSHHIELIEGSATIQASVARTALGVD